MKRVAIMGNAAGGKSTLAHAISKTKNIPHFEIDKILWDENWEMQPIEKITSAHDKIINKTSWILDGMTQHELTKGRLARADTIILIDQPFELHKSRALQRLENWDSLEFRPANQAIAPPADKLVAMLDYVNNDIMPVVRHLVDEAENSGTITYRLSSFEEIDAFKSSCL